MDVTIRLISFHADSSSASTDHFRYILKIPHLITCLRLCLHQLSWEGVVFRDSC